MAGLRRAASGAPCTWPLWRPIRTPYSGPMTSSPPVAEPEQRAGSIALPTLLFLTFLALLLTLAGVSLWMRPQQDRKSVV